MKRVGALFEAIAERSNLARAVHEAAKGKRDRTEVREFLRKLDVNIAAISADLRAGQLEFGPFRVFPIRDPKTRLIHAPPFRDRVAHHAIVGVTGPVFERGAIEHSYACRRGKGQHAALRQALLWSRTGDWYGKIDVEKFYDSVDHGVLRRLLTRRFRERRLLALFDRLIDAYARVPGKGLPIGALTSQYLGNFILDVFDQRMKATGLVGRYLRYMDDIVLWAKPDVLPTLRKHAEDFLGELGLRMKRGGEWNRCDRGLPFLGFVIYPGRVRFSRQGRRRLRRKWTALEKARLAGRIGEGELQARTTALFAYARMGHDVNWRREAIRFSRLWDAQEPAPCAPWRFLEQQGGQVPLVQPQQEEGR